MKTKINFDKYSIVIALLCIAVIVSISVQASGTQNADDAYQISTHSDYAIYHNLDDMANSADYIVIGTFDEFEKAWNMNRDLEDPELESKDAYYEGHIYRFQVTGVIKGDVEQDYISVNIPYTKHIQGEITNQVLNERGEIIKEATEIDPYSFHVVYDQYLEPQLGETVILFLTYSDLFDIYFAPGSPNIIAIQPDGAVELRSNYINTYSRSRTAEQQQVFYSEGGQEIHYLSSNSGDTVEDYLGDITLKDVLLEMRILDNQQIEETLSVLNIEL